MSAMSRNEAGYTQPTALASIHPRSAGSPRMFPLVSLADCLEENSRPQHGHRSSNAWDMLGSGDVVVISSVGSFSFQFLNLHLFAVFHYLFGFQNHSPTSLKVLVIWDASPKPPKPPIIKSTSSTYRLIRVAH